MGKSARTDLEQAGEVKFGQVGIANLRVREWDCAALVDEMRDRVERAPKLFDRAALVVDLGSLSRCPPAAEVRQLLAGLREAGVRPVALAFGTSEIEALARAIDLPLLAKFRAHYEQRDAPPAAAPPADPAPVSPVAMAAQPSLLIDHPVRSGQQVYAQGRDLSISAAVGAGAEVIADGSVHVWGALRGRALAGAQGDTSARIFCREFQAELVAIAGQYKVMEELPEHLRGRAVQVWLEAGRLCFAELGH